LAIGARRGEGGVLHFFRPRVVLVENVLNRSLVACIVPEKDTKKPTALSTGDKYLTTE
jgi:hypothetical protein